jgi:hypothetical protein
MWTSQSVISRPDFVIVLTTYDAAVTSCGSASSMAIATGRRPQLSPARSCRPASAVHLPALRPIHDAGKASRSS